LNGGESELTGLQQTIGPNASLAAGQHCPLQQRTFAPQQELVGTPAMVFSQIVPWAPG
jgi:hypothetical protein